MTASTSEEPEGCWSRYRVTIEPVLATVFFVITLTGSPLTNLVIEQACNELGLETDTCTNDDSTDVQVHKTASNITLWRIIIDTLPGCIMSLITSPWSETNGRKPMMVISLIGSTLSSASLAYVSTIKDINPYWYLITTIPSSISGGPIILILSSYCYLIDITLPKERVLRLAILNEFSAVAGVIASLVTPSLNNMGYPALFGTNAALLFVSLLYVIFYLPESVDVKPENKRTLFTTDHLVDSFRTFFKKRPGHIRSAIYALTACTVLGLLAATGEPDCKYLALIKRFNWTISDYSDFNAVSQVITAIGTLGGIFVLMNLFRLKEPTAAIVIQITLILSSVLVAVSTTPVMFYITSQLRIFSGCMAPVVKGYISKLVPQHDVAKVIAFGSSLEAFMPQVGAVLYANVYNLTVGFYPFFIFFLSAILQIIALIWTIIGLTMLHYGKKNSQRKTSTGGENGDISDYGVKGLEKQQAVENDVKPE